MNWTNTVTSMYKRPQYSHKAMMCKRRE